MLNNGMSIWKNKHFDGESQCPHVKIQGLKDVMCIFYYYKFKF